MVTRMLSECIWHFNNTKKIQAEMKVTVSEMRKSLERINSGVDKVENQIKDLEH